MRYPSLVSGFLVSLAISGVVSSQEPPPALTDEAATCIAIGDLDGDGAPDVVIGNWNAPSQVFLNDGKGCLRQVVFNETMPARRTTCVALGDIDGDKTVDIVLGNEAQSLTVVLNNGKIALGEGDIRKLPGSGSPVRGVALADLDGDKDLDLVMACWGWPNRLWLNDGKGGFVENKDPWPRDNTRTTCVAVADLDGDGDMDIVFGNERGAKKKGGEDSFLLNHGGAVFREVAAERLPAQRGNTAYILVAAFDGGSDLDLILGRRASSSRRGARHKFYQNVGGGKFTDSTAAAMPGLLDSWKAGALLDQDGDGDLDLVSISARSGLCMFTQTGKGPLRHTTKKCIPRHIGRSTVAVAAADMDSDGDIDLVLANRCHNHLILRNDGKGRFSFRPERDLILAEGEHQPCALVKLKLHQLSLEKDPRPVGLGRYAQRLHGHEGLANQNAAKAIAAGLAWLASHQDRDGRWDTDGYMKHDSRGEPCSGAGSGAYDVPMTGLALLALLADGNTPIRGRYRSQVDRGCRWLITQQEENGQVGTNRDQHYIYGHAMATQALCEAYGMSGHPRLKTAAERALTYLEKHRTPYGAWSLTARKDAKDELSISAWALRAMVAGEDMGLEHAFKKGLSVQKTYRILAIWMDTLTNPETGRTGSQTRGEGARRFYGDHAARFPPDKGEAMTAACLMMRFYLGVDFKEDRGIRTLQKNLVLSKPPNWTKGSVDHYYWYFGTHAMYQYGGAAWQTWKKKLHEALLEHQRKDGNYAGSFDPAGVWGESGGRVYSTALCVMALQVPYRYPRLGKLHKKGKGR